MFYYYNTNIGKTTSIKQAQLSAVKNVCRSCIYITGIGWLIIVKQFYFRLPNLFFIMEQFHVFDIHASSYVCDQYRFADNKSFRVHSTPICISFIIRLNTFACLTQWLFHATLCGIVNIGINMKPLLHMILEISHCVRQANIFNLIIKDIHIGVLCTRKDLLSANRYLGIVNIGINMKPSLHMILEISDFYLMITDVLEIDYLACATNVCTSICSYWIYWVHINIKQRIHYPFFLVCDLNRTPVVISKVWVVLFIWDNINLDGSHFSINPTVFILIYLG